MRPFLKDRKLLFYKSAASCAVILLYLLFTTHFSRKDLAMQDNAVFLDRNGVVLRFVPDEKGERHIWVSGKDIPDTVKQAFIAAEDQRFYEHPGFDAGSIFRAVKDNLRQRKIVSGASTITQQTSRLIYPRKRRYRDKFIEILRSVRMELALSKEEILEQYLNRVPMGNNIIGVELAARSYFGKPVSMLSAAEAALLASLPKAPGEMNPYGENVKRLLDRKNMVISQMREGGYLTKEEAEAAAGERLIFNRLSFPNGAPHLVDSLASTGRFKSGKTRTTIDAGIQSRVEEIVKSHETRLAYKGAGQAAAMVVHNPTMEVLAQIGSISYDSRNKGYNNGAAALRSAGSTLKPFVYAQALEDGNSTTSLLEDVLRKYKTPAGEYSPANFDRKEYGPVTMRTALGNSFNISAIKMLEAVGQERFFNLLKSVDLISDPSRTDKHYGLGLVIGNPEVSLEKLTAAYAMLANSGVKRPLRYILSPSSQSGNEERIFSEQASYIITDILSDETARVITFGNAGAMSFPFRVAVKTGTSTKFRDCWAIGYTPEYTVGVWVGNFEGNPTHNLSGASGAAPIFKDIIGFLHGNAPPPIVEVPEGVIKKQVCGISGMNPGPHCDYISEELFIEGTDPSSDCTFHTGPGRFHDLPPAYAAWVDGKGKRGNGGGYRIKGMEVLKDSSFDDEDADHPAGAGIRVRGAVVAAVVKKPETKPVVVKGHLSIGRVEDGSYSTGDGRVSITYPLPNDGFILNRTGERDVIRLEATVDSPMKYVDWFIDGRFYKRAGPPYDSSWVAERGRHEISVVTPGNRGDSIVIKVE